MGRLQSLQVLRFFAALGVVVDHALRVTFREAGRRDLIGGSWDVGAAGVDVFFVLSGFVIARHLMEKTKTAPQFWLDRWWRVAPLYFIASLPAAFLPIEPGDFSMPRLLTTLTFWPAWNRVTFPLLAVGWTLCFEMLFYLSAGLTLASRRAAPLLLALFAAFCLASLTRPETAFKFLGNPIILEFLAGVAIARYWQGDRRPILGGAVIVLALIALGLWFLSNRPDLAAKTTLVGGLASFPRVVLIGLPAAALVYGFLQFEGRWGKLPYLGDASYGLYLIHPLVLWAVAASPLPFWTIPPIGLLLCVAASVAVRELLDKPIADRRPRLAKPLLPA